MLVKLFCKL